MSRSEQLQLTFTGKGGQTLLLGHGFGCDQTVWAPIREGLNAAYRVASYNLAGSGPQGDQAYDADIHDHVFGYADDLLTILDEQQAGPVVYIGHSFSAMIGLVAAAARPQAFDRLILLQGSPRYLNDIDYVGGFEPHQLEAIQQAMDASFFSWASGFTPLMLGPDRHDDDVAKFTETLFLMRPDIASNMLRMIFESDQRAVLPRVGAPVHLVHSHSDIAVPTETAYWLHEHLPGSTLDFLDLEGHIPHLTQPGIVMDALKKILGRP
ncbi:MAG: alpha/beta hydrolase [Castellaniella sp.]|nr:alpha/beta hydrolase [Castellaniella sp.]